MSFIQNYGYLVMDYHEETELSDLRRAIFKAYWEE